MEAGLNGQLFQLPPAIWPSCLMETWSQCWNQCHQLQIMVTTDIQEFTIPHHSDKELMQIFLQDGTSSQELVLLNCCRMYLQVSFISNIYNSEGNQVEQSYWKGKQINTNTKYQWTQISLPLAADWHLWCQ